MIGRIAHPSAVDAANVSGARVSPRHSLRARRECAWRRSEVAGQIATHGIGGLGYLIKGIAFNLDLGQVGSPGGLDAFGDRSDNANVVVLDQHRIIQAVTVGCPSAAANSA